MPDHADTAGDPDAEPLVAARTRRRPVNWRGVGRGLLVAGALTLVGYTSGVAATNLIPTEVATQYYHASVRLSPLLSSSIEVPTVLGDAQVHFESVLPAPGVIVEASVRSGITQAFIDGSATPEELTPSRHELTEVMIAAITGTALRFTGGALLGIGLMVAVARLARARGLTRQTRSGIAAGLVLAIAVPAGAGALTYRPANLGAISATSMLGMAQQSWDALGDIERRTGEASRYVTSALGVTRALQETFTAPHDQEPTALRVLFVSDIHGINQYALLKSVVQEQNIDLVVDSGDLVNFGFADEAAASSLTQGIASLEVPYLFVRGNHDATATDDYAVVNAVARAANAVVLQPTPGEYREVTVAGLRIAGFNDPRFYGDRLVSDPQAQAQARQAFETAFTGRGLPDVVVGHEPDAVAGLNRTSLLVSGHLHVPKLEGNHLTVGTFTGGGLFGARIAQTADEGTEVQTANYSFEIATFDTTCSLATLQRYSFSGILRGRPALTNATLVNGATVVPAATDRSCGGDPAPHTETVPVAPADEETPTTRGTDDAAGTRHPTASTTQPDQ